MPYIQIPNKQALDLCESTFMSAWNNQEFGPYPLVENTIFPLYIHVDSITSLIYNGWQDDLQSPDMERYKKDYDSGIPYKVILYPEKYPEYYI